ncbi:MAG: cob(I)yrinic acid a,c-diamide adenosyltransferase [Deltaproteobacteria bacterium]|nr:MAG: cob(I)yrinic acid a,c-diamide adenosyltransferase [Deltaproteobacteria bacterium]
MVKLTRIYTRGGDKGETSLSDGTRIKKHALRIEAIGAVDEANAAIGMARLETGSHAQAGPDTMLGRIQNDLFDLGADISTPEGGGGAKGPLRILATQVERLEHEIDAMNTELQPLDSFVLPGGTELAAALHVARTVVRRAERLAVALAEKETVNPEAIKYLNRLSDHLFQLARTANDKGLSDVLWRPGANR